MRPVRLEMNGFAAFRDEAVVDFADADFFVLVGATGSGKSTVIDALTFALYGTVPRWNHRSMVMYGLAPTANQGKVALLFDIGDQRYLVARELRRTKTGVSVRNARLERLIDPAASGGIDDDTESIAADSGVTPAVEKLLGLPYEHFCQCVVLPQGEFADFLRARPADRRTILLKLLGAGLYTEIGQRANGRAGQAGVRADLLTQQLAGLSDATESAEAAAAQRESAVESLIEQVRSEVPRLRSTARSLEKAQEKLDRIRTERDALAGLTVPPPIAELDAAHSAAGAALTAAEAAETAARHADRAARERLAAAPARAPLDEALRDHAELDRITAALPGAEQATRAATDRQAAATGEAGNAATALEEARSARDVARGTVADLSGRVEQVAAEIDRLDAVVVPDGLVELAGRTSAAARVVAAAAEALAAAQDRETAAQDAFAAAPDRGPVEESLRLVRELTEAEEGVTPLESEHARAGEAVRAAGEAVGEAEQARDGARAAREHATLTHRAAALRSDLVAGHACPVCDQVVATLPPSLAAPELDAGDEAVRVLDGRVNRLRTAEAKASAAETQAATRLAAARDRIAALSGRLAGQPRDPDALRRTLSQIQTLQSAQRAASTEVRARRTEHERAVAAAGALDAAAVAARSALRSARDPLVALGAPTLDDSDLRAAWTDLAGWASGQSIARRATDQATRAALAAAEETHATARAAFAAADRRGMAARRAVNDTTAAAAATRTEFDGLRTRASALTAALASAPSVAEATAQLRRIDEMAAAVGEANRALDDATAARGRAAAVVDGLTARIGQAWRELRGARDPVIGLGAPDLPEGSVLAGWNTLAAWATSAARSRTAALPDAQDAVTAATRHRDESVKHLVDEFAALGVDPGDRLGGDLADTAPAAAAAALAQARADRARVTERRAQAAAVTADLTKTQEQQRVAHELGRLLRSNQFPEWLEAAALDTLVVDASERLSELSGGQFELTHRDGEFMVVDHADADSIRSVRTLSGGETFQASLALALALSTQLSSMAAQGAARLDSIFLDEGFGTLDEATLEVVAGTLENLAQGDRMVGVVTHVGALADRIPVRFQVRRDSRTSSVERESL